MQSQSAGLDSTRCYRALETRDARFDGRFFTGVRTTGVYCRPVCPARCPKRENVVFYTTAAEAQQAGFRPCLRCRPESSPNLAAWRGTSSTVSRALAMIHDGALDEGEGTVDDLAGRLGIGERQLRRLFEEHLGVSPIAVAQTRRVLFAKQLLHETNLSMTDVALAAGFGSLRRFNDAFRSMVNKAPSTFRRSARPSSASAAEVSVTLSYAPPFAWEPTRAFFEGRAIAGVESVLGDRYRRAFEIEGTQGLVEVRPLPRRNALTAKIRCAVIRHLPTVIARLRRMFDLDADATLIEKQLSKDPRLAAIVRHAPGLRVPGAWDGFELAVRAIVGQQVTVVQARSILGLIAARHGAPLAEELSTTELVRVFPSAQRLATEDLSHLPMPRARSTSIGRLAAAVVEDPAIFDRLRYPTVEDAVRRFKEMPGIGEWTAQYIALRALHDPDAFPSGDVGIQRGLEQDGVRPDAKQLLAMAETWRPWRAYAAQHIWNADAERGSRPKEEDS